MKLLLGLSFIASFTNACSYAVSSHSTKGRAFIVKMNLSSSTFWNCDATKGDPVCYQVKQIKNGE